MSKSRRAVLVALAVLLVLLSAALFFVYHTIAGASAPYSETSMRNFLLETIRSDGASASIWFKGIQPGALRKSADAVVSDLFETSGLASTCVHSIDTRYFSIFGFNYTSVNINYYADLLPSSLPRAETEMEAVELFLDAFSRGDSLLYIATGNAQWTRETLCGIASSVFSNLDSSAEVSAFYCDIYPETGDDRALYLEIDYGVPYADRIACNMEMNYVLDDWAGEIEALGLTSDEDLYRAAHDLLIDRVEYDYVLAEAGDDYEDLTSSERFNRSAYGAAVTGKTVCSGYAYAYKELCDRLDLDCWVASGECGGPHAWNLVLLDDIVYLVDCTNDDGADNIYTCFLVPQRSWSVYGYELEPGYVVPW